PHQTNISGRYDDGSISNPGRSRGIGQRHPFPALWFALNAALIPAAVFLPDEVCAGNLLIPAQIGLQPLRNAVIARTPARVVGAVECVFRRVSFLVARGSDAE